MLLRTIRAVFSLLPARLPEIIYTLLLRQKLVRSLTNRTLLKLIPSSITVEGLTLFLNPNDPVLSSAVAFGIYENYEREVFRSFCRPGDTVVDIGANVGLYTLTAAARVGPAGRVIAVEPHPESFRHLQKTIQENKLSQVTPINVAAGNSQREVSLFVTDANKADSRIYNDSGKRQKLVTKMIDLDSLLAEHAIARVQLIKMDIQGAEGLALQGMTRTLANNPGLVIFAEFWPWGLAQTGVSPSVFLRDLLHAGFRFQSIDEDKRRLIDITDVDQFITSHENLQYTGADMRRSHANLICIRNSQGGAHANHDMATK